MLNDELNDLNCFPPKDIQTRPHHLRSDHIDIKDEQCAETKVVLKKSYHIISRFLVIGVKKVKKMRKKLNFIQKV